MQKDRRGFIEDCLRTEATVFNLKNVQDEGRLFNVLSKAIKASEDVDVFKKSVFYGKELDAHTGLTGDCIIFSKALTDKEKRLLHSAMGMVTEAGEFLEAVIDSAFRGINLDETNLKEEIGDTLWYQSIALDALDTSFSEEEKRVIAKLKHRYPEKFNFDDSENRDLDGERKILEKS